MTYDHSFPCALLTQQRFSQLDLKVIASELRKSILNYRLQNIYDLLSSSRHFLLKFAVPESKQLVVIDPGFRIHTSNFQRPTSQTPSNFVAKLRKHLRTRRLSAITQPVGDRVLVLTFSDGQYHLILEFLPVET